MRNWKITEWGRGGKKQSFVDLTKWPGCEDNIATHRCNFLSFILQPQRQRHDVHTETAQGEAHLAIVSQRKCISVLQTLHLRRILSHSQSLIASTPLCFHYWHFSVRLSLFKQTTLIRKLKNPPSKNSYIFLSFKYWFYLWSGSFFKDSFQMLFISAFILFF